MKAHIKKPLNASGIVWRNGGTPMTGARMSRCRSFWSWRVCPSNRTSRQYDILISAKNNSRASAARFFALLESRFDDTAINQSP